MKKALSIVLACLLLLSLCSCDLTVDTAEVINSMESAGTAEENGKLTRPKWREMTLHVSFGPELELVINECYGILSAKLLNEDAQELLSDIQLENRYYYLAMKEVMYAAAAEGLLKSDTRMKLEAEAYDTSVWTIMTQELLSRPMKHFQEETGDVFSYTVKLPADAPRPLDLSFYNKKELSLEDCDAVIYQDAQFNFIWYYSEYRDGMIVEHLYRAPEEFYGAITKWPDGTYEHTYEAGNSHKWVREAPEETMDPGYSCGETTYRSVRVDGELVQLPVVSRGYDVDGSYSETEFDEDGNREYSTRVFSGGTKEIITYHSNNMQATIEYIAPEGESFEVPFLEMYGPKTYTAEFYKITYDENGNETYIIVKYGDAYAEIYANESETTHYRIVDGEKNWEFFFGWDGSTKAIIDGVTYEDEESMRYYVDNAF